MWFRRSRNAYINAKKSVDTVIDISKVSERIIVIISVISV